MTNSIIKRFLKGMIASAISTMMLVTISQPTVWSDFKQIISSLAIAGIYGAITGSLLAMQKAYSWKD